MAGRLEGQVALVTGASQGIGTAIVERFAAEGAAVVGVARNAAALRQLAGTVPSFLPFVADVQDYAALQAAVAETMARHGKIDILVNNAGFQYTKLFNDTTLEEWQHTQRVNIEAQFVLCKYVVPHMRAAGYGRIINVSSTQSIAVEPLVNAYAASKGAINAFTRSLAVELAEYGILVNALVPGAIRTPMAIIDGQDWFATPEFQEWYIKRRKIPLARPGEADEVASAALFLASRECSYMTGQMLVIDGGLTITF